MSIRSIRFPDDFSPLATLVLSAFQYPENEAWSMQTDEQETLLRTLRSLRRLWPLIRAVQAVFPQTRDLIRGIGWEEGGRLAGVVLTQRRGTTTLWGVATVAVDPASRRRGIARALLSAALDEIRRRGGQRAILAVIKGNLPAQRLYETTGFEAYDELIELQTTAAPPTPSDPPVGFVRQPLPLRDWRPRYELDDRITPEIVRRCDPIEIGRYRMTRSMRLLVPIIRIAQRSVERAFVYRTVGDDRIVAWARYSVPGRGDGYNDLRIHLDPAHPELAPHLVGLAFAESAARSPGRRTEMKAPGWMSSVVAAAEAVGFERRKSYRMMGVDL